MIKIGLQKYCSLTRIRKGIVEEFCEKFEKKICESKSITRPKETISSNKNHSNSFKYSITYYQSMPNKKNCIQKQQSQQ